MPKQFTIAILEPGPSLAQKYETFDALDYQHAVIIAREAWARLGRVVTLHCGDVAVYWWHRIEADGTFEDRNKNSGVPAGGKYEREDREFYYSDAGGGYCGVCLEGIVDDTYIHVDAAHDHYGMVQCENCGAEQYLFAKVEAC